MELLILPLVFLLVSLIIPKNFQKRTAVVGGLISVIVAFVHVFGFDPGTFVELFSSGQGGYLRMTDRLGYDGLSMAMILLTNVIIFVILLSNYDTKYASEKRFNAMIFFMQFALLGVFMSFDLVLFYVFWELSLLPVFLLLFWFGEKNRKRTLYMFFIFTFVGSLAMLFSIFYLGSLTTGNYDYQNLVNIQMTTKTALIVATGFLLAFGVKIPIFPLHIWQPRTYTKSPMAGTMLLGALMLKMALYGIIRWLLPIAPEAYSEFKYIVIILGLIGVIYAAIIAIKQNDLKKIFAYASISHVGLIAAGLMIISIDAFTGAVVQMVNHAFVTVGLFLAVDVIERRLGTRQLPSLGGIAVSAPMFAFWFALLGFATVSIPFTSGFIGEFLLIKGLFMDNAWIGILIGTTLILACVYMFRAYQLSMFGPKKSFEFEDLTKSEWAAFAIVSLVIVGLGVYPDLLINLVKPSLDSILLIIKHASI